jgi:hypothetical protein
MLPCFVLGKRRSQTSIVASKLTWGCDVFANSSTDLNTQSVPFLKEPHLTFYSIRFAAPSIGPLRWQAPELPALNRKGFTFAQSVTQ